MLLLRLRWGCCGGSIRDSWQVRPGRGMWGGCGGWVPGIGGPGGDKNGGRSGRGLGGDPVRIFHNVFMMKDTFLYNAANPSNM